MFYDILAAMSDGEVILAGEFVELCAKMRGNASSIDLAGVSFQLKVLQRETQRLLDLWVTKAPDRSRSYDPLAFIRPRATSDLLAQFTNSVKAKRSPPHSPRVVEAGSGLYDI